MRRCLLTKSINSKLYANDETVIRIRHADPTVYAVNRYTIHRRCRLLSVTDSNHRQRAITETKALQEIFPQAWPLFFPIHNVEYFFFFLPHTLRISIINPEDQKKKNEAKSYAMRSAYNYIRRPGWILEAWGLPNWELLRETDIFWCHSHVQERELNKILPAWAGK